MNKNGFVSSIEFNNFADMVWDAAQEKRGVKIPESQKHKYVLLDEKEEK